MSKPKETTIDSLVKELELAREIATFKENANAMITATMSKAKLLGLDKGDTLTIKHSQMPVFNIQPVRTLTELEKDEFREIALEVLNKV